jgi:amino acid adenylation domain-containing protein
MEKSINEIVRRHDALRTRFIISEGKPVQIISPNLTIEIPFFDLSKLPDNEREFEGNRMVIGEAQTPFDLSKGPLIRARLIYMGENEHILLHTIHHIVSDGWSSGILVREAAALYDAYTNNRPSPLPELPIQYADFAQLQRQWLQGEKLQRHLEFWKNLIGKEIPVCELPTDRPRPAIQTHRGSNQSFQLSPELSNYLNELSRKEKVTMFMLLLAAFKALLYRYTGQEDSIVGSPIANRNRTEIEGLIGVFINMLALKTTITRDLTFRDFLYQVKEVTLGAYDHQDLPIERLVEELQPKRDLSRQPLFQLMFVLQNAPMPAIETPDLSFQPLQTNRGMVLFDLALYMYGNNQLITGGFEYNTDLFDESTITRLIEHYKTLLEGIVENPGQRIVDLPILTEGDKQQLIVEWNDTERDYPRDKCIHELFEAQVEKTPDNIAAVYPSTLRHAQGSGQVEDERLTYKELNERANQLARYLIELGVGPETLVAISVERSIEMIVGLLGILKAGGAYIPIDPEYPKERFSFMLEDAKVNVLLTQERLLKDLPANGAQVVCLDAQWKDISQKANTNLINGVSKDNLAYVIYTSGSTGMPKGVAVQHRSVVNHNLDVSNRYDLKEVDRVLQFYSISFDGAVEEIFPTLISGATLVLRGEDILALGSEFLEFIDSNEITVVNLPTAYWHEWVREMSQSRTQIPDPLRLVIVGGDKVSPDRYKTWSEVVDGRVRLIDTYGPTETTVISTMAEPNGISRLSIGRPIANTKTYILDRCAQPVPIGVPGELHIGGEGLARGYLNRPDLTAERFIPNPFGEEPGERLYRTGDLARYLPDGNIEFVARIDHQVKVRGFRVELGEIENVLREHPAVEDAVIIAWGDSPGEKRLAGYIVSQGDQEPNVSELREFLTTSFPTT